MTVPFFSVNQKSMTMSMPCQLSIYFYPWYEFIRMAWAGQMWGTRTICFIGWQRVAMSTMMAKYLDTSWCIWTFLKHISKCHKGEGYYIFLYIYCTSYEGSYMMDHKQIIVVSAFGIIQSTILSSISNVMIFLWEPILFY